MAAFIDELRFRVAAGKGGDGVVRWLHEKGKEFGGPSGGNGGRGGDVYARATRDVNILANYKNKKEFKAADGVNGGNKSQQGGDALDLFIDLPIGSVITNLATKEVRQLLSDGETLLLAKGGRGGVGNEFFKSSTNQNPTEFKPGVEGEAYEFYIEVELIADAGLIGLPNAGKSSLLNALTNAHSKVGSYAFTTLDPSLGAMHGYILADIPGLIEGASEGRGLGTKFLRHIKRTHVLLHCLSLESDDLVRDYKIIRKELTDYSPELAAKQEVLILTKTDVLDEAGLATAIKTMQKLNKNILTATIIDDEKVKVLGDELIKILRKAEDKKSESVIK